MKKLLIIQNITREAPGLLIDVLKNYNVSYDCFDLSQDLPTIMLENYGAMVILGGPDSANDQTPKMIYERELVKKALDTKMPILGICLGLQILVKVAGGSVKKNHIQEIGFLDHNQEQYTVDLTRDGQDDLLLKNLPKKFPIFQLHGETVELTDCMVLLGIGKHCRNQIVKIAPGVYGLQGHLELTESMLEDWLTHDVDLVSYDKKELVGYYKTMQEHYVIMGKTLCENFLKLAGFVK